MKLVIQWGKLYYIASVRNGFLEIGFIDLEAEIADSFKLKSKINMNRKMINISKCILSVRSQLER